MTASSSPDRSPAPERILLQRSYATEHQQALGPGWLAIPAYFHEYIGVLGPGQWWSAAWLWSRVPEANAWTELPLREWAALSATSSSRLAAALRPGSPLSWLVERDPSRPTSALNPETKTRLPARYRWRCGLPLTPGHQQDVLRWFAEHLRGYGRRPTLNTLVRALEDLTRLPAQEVRGCLGPAARPAPSEPRPLTVREILQLASGLTLPVSVELAQLSQHLYAVLAPQDLISVPEALPIDWLAELGHGALWLYVYAYTRSLLGDTPGVCHLDQGLAGLTTLTGNGRTAVRDWLVACAQHGLLGLPETLPAAEAIALRVAPPTTMPLSPGRAAALVSATDGSPHGTDGAGRRFGTQGPSESDTRSVALGHKPSRFGIQAADSDTGSVGLGHKVGPFGTQAQSIWDTGKASAKPAKIDRSAAFQSVWSTEEEEEQESLILATVNTWMPLPQLALRAGVAHSSSQQLQQAASRLPQEYVALYLENLAADLPAVNAWRNGLLNASRIAAGLREPYRSLALAGPVVVALALRHVLTPDQPDLEQALGSHLTDARDLLDELSAKIPDRVKRERACRLALRALSTQDGRSLRDLADAALAGAQRAMARDKAEDVFVDPSVDADKDDLDPKEMLWSRALAQLQSEIPNATFDLWLRNTRLISLSETEIVIQAPTDFGAQWLMHRMSGAIRRVLGGLLARDLIALSIVPVERDF